MAETRLAFKAGRLFRRGNTNFVDADPTKGAILLQNGEDGLLHFIWKNRSTNEIEEDLILFPGDATFAKVEQSSWGRTYVLKFSSSNQRHFFWMQDADSSRDEEFVGNVNRLLADPSIVPIWYSEGYNPNSAGPSSAPAASSCDLNTPIYGNPIPRRLFSSSPLLALTHLSLNPPPTMQSQPSNATQAKDRNYLQLGHSLARMSRAIAQTADLCELMKVNLDAMRVLSASHAAQFMTVAMELNPDEAEEDPRE
ncbi:hypothetical protein NUW54_g3579 [Trametes sanguinea]|uniref:Uncharacterized protein n=1 Tax=Trametes sanguinea TaxID=158606 RepID=A0ACC1Q1M3_9APHY|nr:hypothetical protein NUW54_g3579 [Trametes sanguinea]